MKRKPTDDDAADAKLQRFLDEVNSSYEKLHLEFEQYRRSRMRIHCRHRCATEQQGIPHFRRRSAADTTTHDPACRSQFWGTKMALSTASPAPSGASYSTAELTKTKTAMEKMLADETLLAQTREWIKKSVGSAMQRKTLAIFEKTFSAHN